MSDYVVHGDELKKIVRLGRRRPMPFAFCPSVGEDESLFATHRKKPPELIARVTRKESGQTKVAYGTFVILGKLMVLTCIKELPAIAKKLKKHMRAERLPLNIRVMDMSGREIEADIDDFDDGEDPFGDGEDEEEDAPDGFVRWNAAPDGGKTRVDRLAQRIEGLKPAILATGGERGDHLRNLLLAVIEAKDGGRRDRAESLVTRLEKEVAALMGSASRPQVAMPAAAAPTTAGKAPPKVKPGTDPAVLRMARRVSALRRRVTKLGGDAGDRLMAALALVAQTLREGDDEKAGDALERIEPAIRRAEAAAGNADA